MQTIKNNSNSKKPEVVIFAGPNGSGKSTIYQIAITRGIYINADIIKASTHCDDLTAAMQAEALRENALAHKQDFTFETVLSTDKILKRCKLTMSQLPALIEICDICHVYDNTQSPYRIFKKRKDEIFLFPSTIWPEENIKALVYLNDDEDE